MFKNTYGNLKKRILDLLFEYSCTDDTVLVAEGDRELISNRMPDAVNTALIRIYESLPTGIGSSTRRLFSGSRIAYERKLDSHETEVFTDGGEFAVYFKYFGNGSVTFSGGESGEKAVIECYGDNGICEKREFVTLEKGGVYKVEACGGVEVYDFAVYKREGFTDRESIPADNEVSFELPSDFERLMYIKTKYGKADSERVRICGSYAFVSKDVCGDGEGILCVYRKKPLFIDETVSESFEFELSPLEFECFVCLAAAELCRQEEAVAYTKLIYKYNDYAEAIIAGGRKIKRNGFYMPSGRRRW